MYLRRSEITMEAMMSFAAKCIYFVFVTAVDSAEICFYIFDLMPLNHITRIYAYAIIFILFNLF